MSRTYLRLWHPKIGEVQTSLDALKWLFRIFKKDAPKLHQVLTFVLPEGTDPDMVAQHYPSAQVFFGLFGADVILEEAQ